MKGEVLKCCWSILWEEAAAATYSYLLCGEDKNILPLQGIELRSLGRADSSLVAIPTTTSLLIRSDSKRTDYFSATWVLFPQILLALSSVYLYPCPSHWISEYLVIFWQRNMNQSNGRSSFTCLSCETATCAFNFTGAESTCVIRTMSGRAVCGDWEDVEIRGCCTSTPVFQLYWSSCRWLLIFWALPLLIGENHSNGVVYWTTFCKFVIEILQFQKLQIASCKFIVARWEGYPTEELNIWRSKKPATVANENL